MRKISGFTLIELIAVILILGILAAVAVPQVVDLRSNARTAAIEGIAGALASGAALNYATRAAGNAGVAVSTCGAATGTLASGLPATAEIQTVGTSIAPGVAVSCTLSYVAGTGQTAIASVIGS